MDNWGIDALISNGGVMIFEGKKEVVMMTKKEQLKIAFKTILMDMLAKFSPEYYKHVAHDTISEYSELLLKEVSIRTNLK